MTRFLQPELVNDPFGDAGLYLDFRFARRAFLFDLGELQHISPRKLLRVSHVFVSHAHMDHFRGFDRLLGVCLGRLQRLDLIGPPGFIDRVEHKLAAYTWNLIAQNETDVIIGVAELHGDVLSIAAEFHSKDAFRRRSAPPPVLDKGIVLDEEEFRVRAVTLDHGIPCLGFAIEEKLRINVWKDGLLCLGLPVGPWLNDLKKAVRRGVPDEALFEIPSILGDRKTQSVSLGDLKAKALRLATGEKIAYVVDAVYHEDNAARIIGLAQGADQLFIETVFLEKDAAIATRKLHLTAAQAGSLARRAGVKQVVPFHFSPRYLRCESALRAETDAAFRGFVTP